MFDQHLDPSSARLSVRRFGADTGTDGSRFEYSLTRIYVSRHIGTVTEATWTALADPHRRAVLDLLRAGERAVGEVVDALRLSQPQASKHLRVLRAAGLVQVRKDAQRRLYRLDPRPIAEVDAWLTPYRQRWNDSLDRLAQHLEEDS